jgi:predicted lipid-binding transport protein (Tim44 family)
MFCPNCGFQDLSQSKFCKRCGTNLRVVAHALASAPSEREEVDVALQREIQAAILKDTLAKRRGLFTGGIIAGCAGIGLMVMLSLMEGPDKAVIGLIPFMVGIGLILSALFVYKPNLSSQRFDREITETKQPVSAASPQALPSYPESVTAETTRQLDELKQPQRTTE